MNKRYLALAIFGVVLLALIVLNVLLPKSSQKQTEIISKNANTSSLPTTTSDNATNEEQISQPAQKQQATPEETAEKFYRWYLSYPSTPLNSGEYKTSPYLSASFKNIIAGFGTYDGKHDPVFCTQNKRSYFSVQPAITNPNGKVGVVLKESSPEGKNLYRFVLQNVDGQWLITDIICMR
jgi:hypothetical protein